MSTLEARIASALEDLDLIPDRQERMAWVVDRAKRAPALPAEDRTDDDRVPGCVSAVWLHADLVDGKLRLRADAESPLVRGLVLFLVSLYDGVPPVEIRAPHENPLERSGLLRDLSPTRQNGLQAVRNRILQLAGHG